MAAGTVLQLQPERLVVTGLRCWMAGYEYGDISCWETAWQAYSNALGTRDARVVLAELQFRVRTLRPAPPVVCELIASSNALTASGHSTKH